MLELSDDNNIEAAIIKVLQVRVNILETNRESQQRNRKYQEMTTIITKINSLGQLQWYSGDDKEESKFEGKQKLSNLNNRKEKIKQNLRALQDSAKIVNIYIIESQRKRKIGVENIFEEIMPEKLPTLVKGINLWIHEVQQTPM